MRYLKKFEAVDTSIDSFNKKIYVSNNNQYSYLNSEIKTLNDHKIDFEIYYKMIDDIYVFNIYAFIKNSEYISSRTLFHYGYQRDDTLKSKVYTSDINIVKQYLNNIKDCSHINNVDDIETEVTANKFNL